MQFFCFDAEHLEVLSNWRGELDWINENGRIGCLDVLNVGNARFVG